jgi:hypothetical protein
VAHRFFSLIVKPKRNKSLNMMKYRFLGAERRRRLEWSDFSMGIERKGFKDWGVWQNTFESNINFCQTAGFKALDLSCNLTINISFIAFTTDYVSIALIDARDSPVLGTKKIWLTLWCI